MRCLTHEIIKFPLENYFSCLYVFLEMSTFLSSIVLEFTLSVLLCAWMNCIDIESFSSNPFQSRSLAWLTKEEFISDTHTSLYFFTARSFYLS